MAVDLRSDFDLCVWGRVFGFSELAGLSIICKRRLIPAKSENSVGKGEVTLSLPVVARGLIPPIYRRASFSHRAAPQRDPPCGEASLTTEWPLSRNSLERASETDDAEH